MASVLAAGEGAVLSHRTAAALWDLHPASSARVEVTAPRRLSGRVGLTIHHSSLPPDEIRIENGIPVTTVPRTLLDLATVLPRHRVESAVNEAERREMGDRLSLADLLKRYPRRGGTRTIRAILAAGRIGLDITRSELEDRFLAFIDRHGLPHPEVNASLQVGGRWFEVDCLWRSERVIVELDGHATHADAASFERDRARDRMLHAAGWQVIRITWHQLHDDSDAVAADLFLLLTG